MSWDIRGKTCVITGASGGIGLETAKALAARGANVILVCRSPERGAAAKTKVQAAGPKVKVDLVVADLGEQAQIRRAAEEILALASKLEVLINNAGALHSDRTLTPDGFETTFAVNHLAYHLLTNLLLDRLKASAPARIINVASDAHRRGRIDFDDLHGKKHFAGFDAYRQSKLANVLFTYELARRLEGTGVTTNCLHPGVIASGFGRDEKGVVGMFFRYARRFLLTEEEGAQTTIHLATAAALEVPSGGYYAKLRPAKSSARSRDRDVARRLWEESDRMVQVAVGAAAAPLP